MDAASEPNVENLIKSYTGDIEFSNSSNIWMASLAERTKFVVNMLSKNNMAVRN